MDHRIAHYSTRNHFVEPPSIAKRLFASLFRVSPAPVQHQISSWIYQWRTWRPTKGWKRRILFRALMDVPNVLVFIWVLALLWGEKWVFDYRIAACHWKHWEKWPAKAMPHHLVFVADPQLVDPHTYPGRPWPLSTFTIWHTDNYMYRSYHRLQRTLHPDTVFFLGDLFDGGREWGTLHGDNTDPEVVQKKRPDSEKRYEKRWKRYGDNYWFKEYNRFGKIFFETWNLGGEEPGPGQRGRKIIASLPGNHDLGFGENIQIPTRDRFEAYFGETNRVDVIGNHSFVSIDAVSLSAKKSDIDIYEPVDSFLSDIQTYKRKAITRELLYQRNQSTEVVMPYIVEDLETADFETRPSLLDEQPEYLDFPTILLTHVPLYRAPGVPCGPLRERYPPTPHPEGTPPVSPDERNALPVAAGFQYQTVLEEDESNRLLSILGNLISVFSGDDHDYCEVVHHADTHNVREITVKSISYAMGVRKPGFQMMSLWNPIDGHGNSLDLDGSGRPADKARLKTATIQTRLCLLPDQLEILIRYAYLVGFSLAVVCVHALLSVCCHLGRPRTQAPGGGKHDEETLLPVANKGIFDRPGAEPVLSASSATSAAAAVPNGSLAVRCTRARSISRAGYSIPVLPTADARPAYTLASSLSSGIAGVGEKNGRFGEKNGRFGAWKPATSLVYAAPYTNGKSRGKDARRREKNKLELVWEQIWRNTLRVACIVLAVFWWLAKHG